MKVSLKKVTLFFSILLLIIAAIYMAGPYLLTGLIENRIVATIKKLKAHGIEIHYDSLYSLPNKIIFEQLDVVIHSPNNLCRDNESRAKITKVEITGIQIMPLLLRHTLHLDSVILNHPEVFHQRMNKKSGQEKGKNNLKSILINHILIDDASFAVIDSASCKPSLSVNFNSKMERLSIKDLDLDSALWNMKNALISSVKIALPFYFYTFKIKEVVYDATEKIFNVDSIQIIPDLNKQLFALKTKHQTDRVEGYIPSIKASDFEITAPSKALFHASNIDLSLHLDFFRDKRYPFRSKLKTLPVRYLHNLTFFIQIDTIHVANSYIAYEEFQEDGKEPGKIFFDELNCKIYNVSNQSSKKALMNATANFMDAGRLKASFTFPETPNKPYTASGTLTNFSLPKVNSMLTTAAHAKISEGQLEELKFQFTYNDVRSDGQVELNYSDLKMTSLLKKKKKKNNFLTFLLRLVVKKDLDDNLPTNKNTGTILFYRDKHRSIFNYWWKSILSGIKSVYNLDKIMDTDGKKR